MVATAPQVDLSPVLSEIRARLTKALGTNSEIQTLQSSVVMESIANGSPIRLEDRAKIFATLEHWKRELEDLLDICKKEAENVGKLLLEDFVTNGMDRITIDGLTIHTRTDRYVNKVSELTQIQICEILKKHGLSYLVSEGYNAQKLKSWVLDKLDDKENGGMDAIPEEIRAALKIGEIPRVVAVKA